MARAFLINTVRGTFGTILAGAEVDDQSSLAVRIVEAGGQLAPAGIDALTTAAAQVLSLRRRGGSDEEANRIMGAALDADQHPIASLAALRQVAFFVDGASGDDNNPGSAAEPIASLQEWSRRIAHGTVSVSSVVQIIGNLNLDPPPIEIGDLVIRGDFPQAVVIRGQRTVERTGTITSVQAWAPDTDTEGRVTDTGVANWTADVGRLIVLTSGSNIGAAAWVMADLGGGDTCRYSPFYDAPAFAEVVPAVNDEYEIVTFSQVTGGTIITDHTGFVNFTDIHFNNTLFPAVKANQGGVDAFFCHYEDTAVGLSIIGAAETSFHVFRACRLEFGDPTHPLEIFSPLSQFEACMVNGFIEVGMGGRLEIFVSSVWQDTGGVVVSNGGQLSIRQNEFLGVFDMPGASDVCLNVRRGGNVEMRPGTRAWGTGNDGANAVGIKLDSGATVYYSGDAVDRFGFAGASLDEIDLAGVITTYAAVSTTGLPAAYTVKGASIVPAAFT